MQLWDYVSVGIVDSGGDYSNKFVTLIVLRTDLTAGDFLRFGGAEWAKSVGYASMRSRVEPSFEAQSGPKDNRSTLIHM